MEQKNSNTYKDWAQLIKNDGDQKVRSKDSHKDSPSRPLLINGNNPTTRILVITNNKNEDNKQVDAIKKDAQGKANKVKYSVVSVDEYTENGTFIEERFISDVKYHKRPTLYIFKSKDKTFRKVHQALKNNNLIKWFDSKSEQLIESQDGYTFYEAMNMPAKHQEPVIQTFSGVSTRGGLKKELTETLEKNSANIPNDRKSKILVVDGSHAERREDGKCKILPTGGQSGLSDEKFLYSKFHEQDCHIVGVYPNITNFNEQSNGDFLSWKPSTASVSTVSGCNPMGHYSTDSITKLSSPLPDSRLKADSLRKDSRFDKMDFRVLNIAVYHKRPELRGTSPDKVMMRFEEFLQDVIEYNPTLIFIAWCFSSNGDVALALRSAGIYSGVIMEYDLKNITSDPLAQLDDTQKEFLEEMCQDDVRHVCLGGSSGVGKSLMGAETIKTKAAWLRRMNPRANIEIYVLSMVASSGEEELFEVWREKYFCGLDAFQIMYRTPEQLCKELGVKYDAGDNLGMVKSICQEADKANTEKENNGQGKSFTLFLFDEMWIAPTGDKKVCDYTGLTDLDSLTTVTTVTCIRPIAYSGSEEDFSLKLPGTSATQNLPLSFCSRVLTVTYRNTQAIRDFNNFMLDHDQNDSVMSRSNDSPGQHLPPGPAGRHAVTWIQCSREEDMGVAAKKVVQDRGTHYAVVLYGDESEKAAQATGAHKICSFTDFCGAEAKCVVIISNRYISPESISRAREEMVIVTGPRLDREDQQVIDLAAQTGHSHTGQVGGKVKCREHPCPWTKSQFPLLQHKVVCSKQGCANQYLREEGGQVWSVWRTVDRLSGLWPYHGDESGEMSSVCRRGRIRRRRNRIRS